jgi:hypothetical protein
MRVLAVREPWASLIISGQKTIELRTMPTNIRERIAIYATRTKIRVNDMKWLESTGASIPCAQKGKIIGTIKLSGCYEIVSSDEFKGLVNCHLCDPALFQYQSGVFGWQLQNPLEVESFEYKMKRGSVVWGFVDDKLIQNEVNNER